MQIDGSINDSNTQERITETGTRSTKLKYGIKTFETRKDDPFHLSGWERRSMLLTADALGDTARVAVVPAGGGIGAMLAERDYAKAEGRMRELDAIAEAAGGWKALFGGGRTGSEMQCSWPGCEARFVKRAGNQRYCLTHSNQVHAEACKNWHRLHPQPLGVCSVAGCGQVLARRGRTKLCTVHSAEYASVAYPLRKAWLESRTATTGLECAA